MIFASTVTGAGVRPSPRAQDRPTVFAVDGDPAARVSLEMLIRRAGWQPETFACAEEFLSYLRCLRPSCLVRDLALPDISGLELQRRVGADIPIIFVTGRNDVAMTVQAMKAGAVAFLTKPFSGDVVVGAIQQAIECSKAALGRRLAQRCARPLRKPRPT